MRTIRAVALLLCAATAPLGAQAGDTAIFRGNSNGLFLAGHLHVVPGITVGGPGIRRLGGSSDRDVNTSTGGGLGVMVGYASLPVTLYVGLDAAAQGSDAVDADGAEIRYGLGHLEVGARFHWLRGGSRMAPYLTAAVGIRALAAANVALENPPFEPTREDVSASGSFLSGGGGVLYYFGAKTALDVGVVFTGGQFSEAEVDNVSRRVALDASLSTRVRVGVTWYPVRRR
jgi:hypothetical protein